MRCAPLKTLTLQTVSYTFLPMSRDLAIAILRSNQVATGTQLLEVLDVIASDVAEANAAQETDAN